MHRFMLTFMLLLGVAAAGGQSELWRKKAERNRFPAKFASVEEATEWAKGFFAGGHVDEVILKPDKYLVLFQYGSGLPVIRIGLYHWVETHWQHVTDFPPPKLRPEFLRAKAIDGAIYLVGESSGVRWRFHPAE